MCIALKECWGIARLWREEEKIDIHMANEDLTWNSALNLKKNPKPYQYLLSVLERLQEYFSLQFHLLKTEKLKTEDNFLIFYFFFR